MENVIRIIFGIPNYPRVRKYYLLTFQVKMLNTSDIPNVCEFLLILKYIEW